MFRCKMYPSFLMLRSPPLTPPIRIMNLLISVVCKSSSSFSSSYSTVIDREVKFFNNGDRKGKWFTLPRFNSVITTVSTEKDGGRTFDVKKETTVTALKWVLKCCPQVPRCLVQKLFRLRQVRRESFASNDNVLVNPHPGEPRLRRVSEKDLMAIGDQVYLPITVHEFPSKKHAFSHNDDEMNFIHSLLLHKDPAIIAVNKPPGIPVQGGVGIKKSFDVLASQYMRYDYSEPPRLVHRLDRDCSGILVMGRTQTSATILHSVFREKTFGASSEGLQDSGKILKRKYWALVIGTPNSSEGLISAPLSKVLLDNGKADRITITNKNAQSQHAITEYKVISSSASGFTWLELMSLTGRKHQLRVHCAEALGTPIVGDYKYGWYAHRKWLPVPCVPQPNKQIDDGSVCGIRPLLHLHSKQMILPDISLSLEKLQFSTSHDLLKVRRLDLVAPLPPHMKRSWDVLSSGSS